MKKRSIVFIVILLLIIGIQFIPIDKPEVIADNPNDLISNNEIPEHVVSILKNACYDCHSNETKYPWYSYVYPVKVPIYKHIYQGRDDLNFSDWESHKKLDKLTILEEISSEVSSGEMPLEPYTRLHGDAKLTDEQVQKLVSWTEEFAESLFQ